MESEIEKKNQQFWIHHAIDALFHANLAFCMTQGNKYSSVAKKPFWQGLFIIKLGKAIYSIIYTFNEKNCINLTQELSNLAAIGVCFYGFNNLNFSLNIITCLCYTFVSFLLSLSRAATFSNVTTKGYEVITVCTVKGLNYVFRGLAMIVFWMKLEGKIMPSLTWTMCLMPFMVACCLLWIVGVATLIMALRHRNKDRKRIVASVRCIINMGVYFTFAVMFKNFAENSENGIVLAIFIGVVSLFDIGSAIFLMKRESDEVKEGHTLFVVTRRPLSFTL